MLKQRVASALILLPLVVALAWLGHPWMTLGVALALAVAAWEFARLGTRLGHRALPALSVAVALALTLERGFTLGRYQEMLLVLVLIAAAVVYVLQPHSRTVTESWAITALAGIYVGLLGSYLVALRALSDGLAWLVLAVVTVWIGDTGAYLVGRATGRHKLAPLISPGKTWEGVAGGLAAALAGGVAIAWLAGLSPAHGLVAGLVAGAICPFGDLAKSLVKREAGVKDSSNLIPGHGGMLDRVDTLLFAAPLMYYYATLVAGATPPG